MSVHLKNLIEADAGPLADLHQRCFDNPWSYDSFVQFLQSQAIFGYGLWQSDENQEVPPVLVAFLLGQLVGDCIDILTFASDPDYRCQGHGSLLLKSLIHDAQRLACQKIYLDVNNNNQAALSLYQKNGFKNIAVRSNYYAQGDGKYMDALVMVLELHSC